MTAPATSVAVWTSLAESGGLSVFEAQSVHAARAADATRAFDEASKRTPVLLLHGFAGTHRTWDAVAVELSRERRVLAPDLPGHGASTTAAEACTMEGAACALDAVLAAAGVGRAFVLGYSMGGRLALYYALTRPPRCAGLILESASPGLAEAGERDTRRLDDERLARAALDEGIDRFIERWERTPAIAPVRVLDPGARAAQRAMRSSCSAEGLAASLRGMGTGAMPWLGDGLAAIEAPALFVSGDGDAKFTGLARTMCAAMPDARRAVVARCGHNVHLEAPAEHVAVVRRFIDEIESRGES